MITKVEQSIKLMSLIVVVTTRPRSGRMKKNPDRLDLRIIMLTPPRFVGLRVSCDFFVVVPALVIEGFCTS